MSYLHDKTVFIVGAGASCEVNLPSGLQLRNAIAKALEFKFENGHILISGDSTMYESLQQLGREDAKNGNIGPFLLACQLIQKAMPIERSIDNFINAHRGNKYVELCGKLAIVRTILNAERNSDLYFDDSNIFNNFDFERLSRTWLSSLMGLIIDNCTVDDLPRRLSSIALVIFNYDRCVEHYLYYTLQTYWNISAADAAGLMKQLEIYHAYGSVGSLPWLDQRNAIAFGEEPEPKKLRELAGKIKTFTESTDPSSRDIVLIRQLLSGSPRLVFLGFAFHPMNLDLLMPLPQGAHSISDRDYKTVFGTVSGISKADSEILRHDLVVRAPVSKENIYLSHLTCKELFSEHQRALSLV